MNVKFKFKGLTVKAPKQDVHVKLDEITYEVENANVLEIAQASKEIMSSFMDVYREMESVPVPDLSFADFNSGDEGLTHTYELGDYVSDGNIAGTIIAFDEEDSDIATIVIQETKLTEELGTEITAYIEHINYASKGTLVTA